MKLHVSSLLGQSVTLFLNISAKSSQIFTKLSAYFQIGLLSQLIIFICAHMLACTHSMLKRPCTLSNVGPFLKFFRLDVCSIRYGCKHPSSPKVSGLHACVHVWRSVKIGMSIHETSMRNFYFHHHPQILHCFGALLIIETCVHIYAHCVHMRAPITTNFFCASLIPT